MFKKVGRALTWRELSVLQDRHQGSALVQRSAPKNQMPAPIANFEGVNNSAAASPPDTEGDIGPNYYMQWVNLPFRDLPPGRDARDAGHARATSSSPARPSAAARPGTAATRSSSTTSSRTAGSRPSSRIRTIRARAVLPVRRLLVDGRPDGNLVRLPVRRPADEAQRLPEVRRLADAARLHDHGQPVLRARRRLGRRRRLRARARRDDERLRQRADALQGHVHGRTEPLGRHAPGGRSTARRCRPRTRLRR